jgi:hypothetical protein
MSNDPMKIARPLHNGHLRTPGLSALSAAVVLACAPHAHAVHVNSDGYGQALIYPYYTVRGGFTTLFTVVNAQDNFKAVKVRFLEARNARPVLDFNLYLSPQDTFTGALVPTVRGARLITNDNSCVTPSDLFVEMRTDSAGLPLNEFKNYLYTGSNTDNADLATLDRTREGYFEVIEMGTIEPDHPSNDSFAKVAQQTLTGYIKQNSAGVPANCGALDAFENFPGNTAVRRFPNIGTQLLLPPKGGLSGRVSLIDAELGANLSYRAVALDSLTDQVNYSAPGVLGGASLAAANPPISITVTKEGMVRARWPETLAGRINAVSAALMRASILNEYVLDNATASQTDWIVTFPTRGLHFGLNPVTAPFATVCEEFEATPVNREGVKRQTVPAAVPTLPPTPPGAVPASVFCNAANVLAFGDATRGSLTGSVSLAALKNYEPGVSGPTIAAFITQSTTTAGNRTTPSLRGVQGPNGVFQVSLRKPARTIVPVSATLIRSDATTATVPGVHLGLPAVGVMLHNYGNAGVSSRYGGVIEHKYLVVAE